MAEYILAIDAGTTGIRVVLYDREGVVCSQAYAEFPQYFPQPGLVEQDAMEIWHTTQKLLREVVAPLERGSIAGLGITNQRETTVLWDSHSGKPLHRAIVWQDRRTAGMCRLLEEEGHEELFRSRTGLVLDPYFSGTKLRWLLDTLPDARAQAARGAVRFGTIDSWILWNLTGGKVHATDPTNASRTLLYDIHHRRWDDDLLEVLDIPPDCLPEVFPSCGEFGETDPQAAAGLRVPVAGIAGDQQAALFGQGCVKSGQLKNTYGTGGFALLNCGQEPIHSRHGLLLTLACGPSGEAVYALEGSVFSAGATIQWLRDGLGLIEDVADSEALAGQVADSAGVVFVPAFTGLGAPYWDPEARGAILGLTRGTTQAHIIRAALEGIAFQTIDLIRALENDLGEPLGDLRVDGGAARNDLLMQIQADLLGRQVIRPHDTESTARGAAYLAGLATGVWTGWEEIRALQGSERTFEPTIDQAARESAYAGWQAAVQRVRSG